MGPAALAYLTVAFSLLLFALTALCRQAQTSRWICILLPTIVATCKYELHYSHLAFSLHLAIVALSFFILLQTLRF